VVIEIYYSNEYLFNCFITLPCASVCVLFTRYLRGTCQVVSCPFSHKVAKEKMPLCQYFLRGVCSRDGCPYLHVNVGLTAEVCADFVAGYCPLGEEVCLYSELFQEKRCWGVARNLKIGVPTFFMLQSICIFQETTPGHLF